MSIRLISVYNNFIRINENREFHKNEARWWVLRLRVTVLPAFMFMCEMCPYLYNYLKPPKHTEEYGKLDDRDWVSILTLA